ncbi:MAG: endonuclease NucS [Candidatus Thorarchaeota archaeon]
MVSTIEVWQIKEGKLFALETTMADAGRMEVQDLQEWVLSHPELLGSNIKIIGNEVWTESKKRIDILGLDEMGNTVIIELKRDKLPRLVLAQAIDYASDVASWDLEKLSEIYNEYTNDQSLEEFLEENYENPQELSINETQRIMLVGTSIEDNLLRMIEWLSTKSNVVINFVLLRYIKTEAGEEFLARTVKFSEKDEQERIQKQQRRISKKSNPPTIIQIDSTEYEGGNVYRILTCTAEWLISKGKLTKEDCPVQVIENGKRYLVNSEPYHPAGDAFRSKKKLKNDLYIDTSYNLERTEEMARRLLEYFKYSRDILKVEYEKSNLDDNDD